MKIRRYSFFGLWPAFGIIVAGIGAEIAHEQKTGLGLISFGLIYIAAWFIFGLIYGKN